MMYRPSFVTENLMYSNDIMRFIDNRVDFYSREYVFRKLVMKNPAVGYAIVQSIRKSEHDKLELLFKRMATESILITICGKRGSGKTALTYWIAEQIHLRYPDKQICYVGGVGVVLPDFVTPIMDISEADTGAFVICDEAAILYPSRRSSSTMNVDNLKQMAVSRHKERTILYITQHSSALDISILRFTDVFLLKKISMGDFGSEKSRREIVKSLDDYIMYLQPQDISETLYLDDMFNAFLFKNELPSFWSEQLSKPYRRMLLSESPKFIVECADRGLKWKRIVQELQARDVDLTLTECKAVFDAPKKYTKTFLQEEKEAEARKQGKKKRRKR